MTISLQINADVRGQREVDRLNTSMRTLGATSDVSSRALRALSTVLAGLSFGLIAREITRSSDAMRSLNAQLRATGSSATIAAGQIGRIAQIAQTTGTAFEGVADVFTRLQRSTREFGASTAQIATATTAIQQSFALAGSSAGEASSSALQLGQALSSGALQGDELRSILENNAVLAGLIADEFGVGVGELRRLGAQGELVSERVFGAILNGAQDINAQFAGFGNLYSQSANRIRNASTLILSSIGELFDEVTGVNNSITEFTQSVVDAFNDGRIRRVIINFIRFIREQFASVRAFLDNLFENLGLGNISEEVNRNLALFVVSAASLAAFSAAGTALGVGFRVGFAIAAGPARLIRAFGGAIGRQAARTNIGQAGISLGNSLRNGFQTVGLIPTVTAPSRMTAEAVGATTSTRVRGGIRPIVIPITGISVLAGRQIGLQTSSRVSAGIFPVVQTVAPVSRLAARRVAQTTRGRLTDSVVSAPIQGTAQTNLRGLGGSIASVIAAGIGSFAGWEVARSVADNFGIPEGSFASIGFQLAGSILGALTAELAIAFAPAIVAAIAAAPITLPVLTITAIIGGIVVAGLSLSEWIRSRVRAALDSSSANDITELPRQSGFDTQYSQNTDDELTEEVDRLNATIERLNTRLQDRIDLGTANLNTEDLENITQGIRLQSSDLLNAIERAEGRLRSIARARELATPRAEGGLISGSGSGTSDSILARLSNGEFVINARATREYLPLLETINSGDIPAFGPGGVVGETELTPQQTRRRNLLQEDIEEAQRRLNDVLASYDITLQNIERDTNIINDPTSNRRVVSAATANRTTEINEQERLIEAVEANSQALLDNRTALENFDMMISQGSGNPLASLFDFDFMAISMMLQQTFTNELSSALRSGDFSNIGEALLDNFTGNIIDGFAMNVSDSLFSSLNSFLTPENFASVASTVSSALSSVLGGIDFSQIIRLITGFFGFNTGGIVPTTSSSIPGVDSVPTLLTPGETVIPVGGSASAETSNSNVIVNLEVVGDVSASTRREITMMLPQIINATQATLSERRVLNNA